MTTTCRRTACVAVVALLAAFVLGPSTGAQTRRGMKLLDVAELPRAIDPQLSPDGKSVVYLLSHADWKADRPVYNLWRQDVGGGAPLQLTFSEGGESPGTRWSPDGRTILFLRGGQILLLPVDGGEARALTHHATSVSSPAWTPDGSAVYFLASDPPTAEERERDRIRDDVYAVDETTFKQRHLWKIVVATGAEQQITSGDSSVIAYRISRDGTRIALQRSPTPLFGDWVRGEVWVMDANGQNARVLTSNSIEEDDPELSPDNSQVLFLADANARQEPYYNTNLFIVPAGGGTPKLLLPDFQYAIDQATWAPDGRSIFAVVNMGVHSEVFQISVASPHAKQLTEGKHFITPGGWSVVASAGKMMIQFDEPTRFGDIWTMPIGGDQPPARATSVFDRLERNLAVPRQDKIEWKSADGTTIEGLLFYPLDYEAGTRYPLVVQLHGGPHESDKFGAGAGLFQNYFPVLTAKGYAVLRPNYRGSTGYGNAFMCDVVNGGYFRNMPGDVLAGVDRLIQLGIADPDRLAIMGWSAGGTLVNKLITVTDRFKAASSGAGVADWTPLWAQTDSRSFRVTWFPGTPWQRNARTDLFWDASPIKDIANARTPTLFFVGESDARVPLAQSQEMYRALVSNHVPTHLYVAAREGHFWGGLHHLLFKANTELDWFEKYVMSREYVWEKAPGEGSPAKSGS